MTQHDRGEEPQDRKARLARLFDLHRQALAADRPADPVAAVDSVVTAAFAQIFQDNATRSLRGKPRR